MKMKKYILILFSILSLCSCTEDNTVDITVMPPATTTGADTFGCLVDGWIYVGGRYWGWHPSPLWTHDSFFYYKNEEEDKLSVSVRTKETGFYIEFTLLAPKEGEESVITNVKADGEELEAGTAFVSRFDTNAKIISATFGNGNRLTNGRFDIHYAMSGNN